MLVVPGVLLKRLEGRIRILMELRSSGRLRMLLGIGRGNRPSTGICRSSYTCLTEVGDWKREIKHIRKLTRVYKPPCRTLQRHGGSFALNTARVELRSPAETQRACGLFF